MKLAVGFDKLPHLFRSPRNRGIAQMFASFRLNAVARPGNDNFDGALSAHELSAEAGRVLVALVRNAEATVTVLSQTGVIT